MGVGQCTAWARETSGLASCGAGQAPVARCATKGVSGWGTCVCPSASRPLLWLFLKRQCSERSSLSSSYSFFLSKNSEKGGTSARANDSWLHWRDRQEPRGSGAGGAAVAHMVPSCHGWGCTTEGGAWVASWDQLWGPRAVDMKLVKNLLAICSGILTPQF